MLGNETISDAPISGSAIVEPVMPEEPSVYVTILYDDNIVATGEFC